MEEKIRDNMVVEELRTNPYGTPIQATVFLDTGDDWKAIFRKSYHDPKEDKTMEERKKIFREAVVDNFKKDIENMNSSVEVIGRDQIPIHSGIPLNT